MIYLNSFAEEYAYAYFNDPPHNRKHSIKVLLGLMKNIMIISTLAVGLFAIVYGWRGISDTEKPWTSLISPWIMFVGGFLFFFAPLLQIARYFHALENGTLAYATIERLVSQKGFLIAPSYFINDFHCFILHNGREQRVTFGTDRPWSYTLQAGDIILVVVHPYEPKILIPIGPEALLTEIDDNSTRQNLYNNKD
jgi:ABC-type multidrug transport system fused ATPase/permease subunit